MQYITNVNFLAQVYGGCSYGGSSYENSTCQTTATGGSASGSGSSGSPLTDTGFDILLIATLACTLIFVALVIRFWRRPKNQRTDDGSNNRSAQPPTL